MYKYTIKINGMKCPHCEAHMDEALKAKYNVKKVKSSHEEKQTILITEDEITEDELKKVVTETGYSFISFTKEPYKKKFLFF